MKNKTPIDGAQPSAVLVGSVKRILKPLVGFLMDNGLTLQWLTRILKEVYVEVATEEFSIDGSPITNSRVSLITGVHRKDIASIQSGKFQDDSLPQSTMLSSRLLATWLGDNRFTNSRGKPRKLPRHSQSDGKPCFDDLVAAVSTDIRAKPILDEWLNLHLVSINKNDEVVLEQAAFLPSKDHDQKLYFLGKNVSDHLHAARVNTQSDEPPFLERSVYYDELSTASLSKLEALAREEGMRMLQTLNRKANQLQKSDARKKSEHAGRMTLGVYYFHDAKDENTGNK